MSQTFRNTIKVILITTMFWRHRKFWNIEFRKCLMLKRRNQGENILWYVTLNRISVALLCCVPLRKHLVGLSKGNPIIWKVCGVFKTWCWKNVSISSYHPFYAIYAYYKTAYLSKLRLSVCEFVIISKLPFLSSIRRVASQYFFPYRLYCIPIYFEV